MIKEREIESKVKKLRKKMGEGRKERESLNINRKDIEIN